MSNSSNTKEEKSNSIVLFQTEEKKSVKTKLSTLEQFKTEVDNTQTKDLMELGDFTINSIDDLLDEIKDLFPSSYVLTNILERASILRDNWMVKSIFYKNPSEENQIKSE